VPLAEAMVMDGGVRDAEEMRLRCATRLGVGPSSNRERACTARRESRNAHWRRKTALHGEDGTVEVTAARWKFALGAARRVGMRSRVDVSFAEVPTKRTRGLRQGMRLPVRHHTTTTHLLNGALGRTELVDY
jgi:hypothetical protein